MNHLAAGELYHLLVLLRVVHLDQNKIPEAEKQDLEMIFRPEVVGEDFYCKLTFVVLEYERRGWLLDTPPLPAAGDEWITYADWVISISRSQSIAVRVDRRHPRTEAINNERRDQQ